MGYRPRPEARTARGFARPRKTRSKSKSKKPRAGGAYAEQKEAQPVDEVVSRTLSSFETLGQQAFAGTPFHEYFEDWLFNLGTAVDDFMSSRTIAVDDQFKQECSRILSETRSLLENIKLKESSHADILRRVSDLEQALTQSEHEHAVEMRENLHREEGIVKGLENTIRLVQEELEAIRRTRAGFLATMSRKTKELKEQEASKRLDTANKELEETRRSFVIEKSRLEEQYQHRTVAIQEQVSNLRSELDKLEPSSETDESAKIRLAAGLKLSQALKDMLERLQPATASILK